eukprot:766551-Hanusia_phi.AAC.1
MKGWGDHPHRIGKEMYIVPFDQPLQPTSPKRVVSRGGSRGVREGRGVHPILINGRNGNRRKLQSYRRLLEDSSNHLEPPTSYNTQNRNLEALRRGSRRELRSDRTVLGAVRSGGGAG